MAKLPKSALTEYKGRGIEGIHIMADSSATFQANSGRAHVLRVWVEASRRLEAPGQSGIVVPRNASLFHARRGKGLRENPCKTIAFSPKNDTERQVARWRIRSSKPRRTPAIPQPSVRWWVMNSSLVEASSYSDKLQSKRGRMEDFDRSKDGGVAPTPLLSARMFAFGDAVLMLSRAQNSDREEIPCM